MLIIPGGAAVLYASFEYGLTLLLDKWEMQKKERRRAHLSLLPMQ